MTLSPIRYPEALSKILSENTAEIGLRIPKELAYFEGHFPNLPIVPGVVQLHWAVIFAKDSFNISGVISKCSQLKFSKLMRPLEDINLILEHLPEKSLILYRFQRDKEPYASGRFTYVDKEAR